MNARILCLVGLLTATARLCAAPLSTAFTYQSVLETNGHVPKGHFDLEFPLYDAATLGAHIGATINRVGLVVQDGLVLATSDFGASAFDGQARGNATATAVVPEPESPDPEWLQLNVVAYGNTVTLTWSGLPAVQLESAEELAAGATRWVQLTEGVQRFGGVAQVTLPAVQSQRFFRLVLH
jgi:hypothetical protein